MRRIIFGICAIVGLAAITPSCETDFSLNGDYTITPVVFGLLDQNQSTHMIKITKAYLGDGDNLVYAQNPDSNYFQQVDARVIEYVDSEPSGREWSLYDSIITNKDTSGLFYGPEQKVYVFREPALDENAEYELIIDINEGQHEVKGRTTLLSGFDVSGQLSLPTYKVTFNNANPTSSTDYKAWIFTVTEALNAADYNYKYTFNFTEFYMDGSSQSFSLERNEGNQSQEKPSNPQVQTASFGGLSFFEWLDTQIPDDDNVDYRIMTGLDLQIAVAHEDLAQYIDVAQPVTSISQVEPVYTNLENSLGLFSSRFIYEQYNFRLVKNSMRELCIGQFTGTKKFCSQYVEDNTESWACP